MAKETKPVAVRLRRDFSVVINLIKIIAILYQQQREIDANGSIIATSRVIVGWGGLIVEAVVGDQAIIQGSKTEVSHNKENTRYSHLDNKSSQFSLLTKKPPKR